MKKRRKTCLDLDGAFQRLPLLSLASDGLGTHNTTTPVTLEFLILRHVASLDGVDELGKLVLVLLTDLGECKDSGSLSKLA